MKDKTTSVGQGGFLPRVPARSLAIFELVSLIPFYSTELHATCMHTYIHTGRILVTAHRDRFSSLTDQSIDYVNRPLQGLSGESRTLPPAALFRYIYARIQSLPNLLLMILGLRCMAQLHTWSILRPND